MKRTITLFCLVAAAGFLSAQSNTPQPERKTSAKHQLPPDSLDNKVRYSVIGSIDVMYGYFKRNQFGALELSLINGIRFKRSRVGIGISVIGVFYFKQDDFYRRPYNHPSWMLMRLPGLVPDFNLFVNYQQEFCRSKVRPTVGVSLGYPVFVRKEFGSKGYDASIPAYFEDYWQGRGLFYGSVEAGFKYRVRKRVYFNHSLFYKNIDFNIVSVSTMKNTYTGEYFYKRINEKGLITLHFIGLSTKVIF